MLGYDSPSNAVARVQSFQCSGSSRYKEKLKALESCCKFTIVPKLLNYLTYNTSSSNCQEQTSCRRCKDWSTPGQGLSFNFCHHQDKSCRWKKSRYSNIQAIFTKVNELKNHCLRCLSECTRSQQQAQEASRIWRGAFETTCKTLRDLMPVGRTWSACG